MIEKMSEGGTVSQSPTRTAELKLVLRHFASTTTVGGLTQICNSPSKVLTFFWFLIVGCFAGLTFYNTYTVFLDYYSYPVVTYVSLTYERTISFPAVTVCNLNPVPCTNLANAYLRDPEKYEELWVLSGCNMTVTSIPLLYKVPVNEETDDGGVYLV
jgi:acid-sensing ion channel 5